MVFATGAQPELAADVFEVVTEAWREHRRMRLLYAAARDGEPTERDVDTHALFLQDGAWYARVYCHLRREVRNLALHRMRNPVLLAQTFERDPALVESLLTGNAFNYETVKNVRVHCSREKADIIRERQWFPGQKTIPLPDGALEINFTEAPKPTLLYWILSYAGHLTILDPPEMTTAVHNAAERILRRHTPRLLSEELET